MRTSRLCLFAYFLLMVFGLRLSAQTGESYQDLTTSQIRSNKLGTPEGLRSFIVDGKLRLSLRDAVVVTLENNSLVRVQETQVESSKYALLGAHAPFDPLITSTGSFLDTVSPPFTLLQGTGSTNVNFKSTAKNLQFGYSQTFETGTKRPVEFCHEHQLLQ